MAERKRVTIHASEWDLLEALWARERGTARDVTEALAQRRGWAPSTVKTLLDRMVQKGLVSARQVGNVWEYTPAVKPVEARRAAWTDMVDKAFGGAIAPALHFLARDARLSRKQLAELRELLEAQEKVSRGKKKEDRRDE